MKKKSKARARTFTIAEVYGKLIKKGDKLRKHIEAGRSEYQKELDDNEAQINRLAEFQQANNGNNGGEQQPQGMQPQQQMPMGNPGIGQPQFSRNGGHLNMYYNGGYGPAPTGTTIQNNASGYGVSAAPEYDASGDLSNVTEAPKQGNKFNWGNAISTMMPALQAGMDAYSQNKEESEGTQLPPNYGAPGNTTTFARDGGDIPMYDNGGRTDKFVPRSEHIEVWDDGKFQYDREGKKIFNVQQRLRGEDGKKYWQDVDPKSDVYRKFHKSAKEAHKVDRLNYKNPIEDRYQGNKSYKPSAEFLKQLDYQKNLQEGDDDFYRKGDTDILSDIVMSDMGTTAVPTTRKDFRLANRYDAKPYQVAYDAMRAAGFKNGGNIPMYWHGGYHNYDQYDRNPPRKTRSRRVRNAYGMYDEPDRSDEYLSAEQIQDMEANRDTNSMNTIYRPSSTSNTWRNAPPSGIVNINYPEEEMDPNETHPIPSSPTTPSTPPTAVSKVGQGNTSDERLRNTDYATMIAKGLPIASDIYDSLQEAEYAEAQKHPYEGDILGAKVNLVDYNPQLAELRRREEITKANIPGMSGGSPNQALLATSASGLGYSEKAADLIRQNQLQNAMIKNQYDQERRGNLMALGNFDVQQNAMEAEERRIAEATGRNFRRSAIDKGAQFATVEEEKAYQMGTLEDLYANYNYNPATKKWEYKGEDNLT